jgi:P27 family predicted phage terminase small subunit
VTGLVGRRPKPASLQEALGNPGHRPKRHHEPRPDPGRPPRPEHLNEIARAEWDRLVELLDGMKTLTVVDGPILESTVIAYAQNRAATAVVEERGLTYTSETEKGEITRPRPEVAIIADSWRRYVGGLSHLGLTPATRGKVTVRKEKATKVATLLRFRRKDEASE